MPLSKLQRRIIELSSRIVSTDDHEEFNRIVAELKAALREHAESLRRLVDQRKKHLTTSPTVRGKNHTSSE